MFVVPLSRNPLWFSNISLRSSFVFVRVLSLSLKVCPGDRKCWSMSMDVAILQSSRCLLILMFAGGSDFPTYWIFGHSLHSMR